MTTCIDMPLAFTKFEILVTAVSRTLLFSVVFCLKCCDVKGRGGGGKMLMS